MMPCQNPLTHAHPRYTRMHMYARVNCCVTYTLSTETLTSLSNKGQRGLSAVALVSTSRSRLKSCYRCNYAVTTRKAPALLRGLLQFDLCLERRTRFELATFCLEGRSSTTELPPHLPVQIKFKLTSSIPFLPVRAMEGRLSRADNISALTTLC